MIPFTTKVEVEAQVAEMLVEEVPEVEVTVVVLEVDLVL